EGGQVSGGGICTYGDYLAFLASANSSYSFLGWYYGEEYMSGSPSFTLNTGSFLDTHTLPITSTEHSFTFTGKFEPQTPPPGWLMITIDASPTGKGELSGAGKYPYGEDVTLGATPINYYDFGGWYTEGNLLSEELPYTFNTSDWLPTQGVTDTLPIVAWFPPIEYQFNVVADPPEGGEVMESGKFRHGDPMVLSAIPNDNYLFKNWTFEGAEFSDQPVWEGDSTFFFARSTCIGCNEFTIVGNFDLDVPDSITVDLRPEPPEGGQVSGGGQFPKGSSTVISALPNPGYGFGGWYYDPCGSFFSDYQSLTIGNLQEDWSLFASFYPLSGN
ncbi:MAG: InlB B-repeat-containing protein, partial [Mesotoga sp.]|nr:InlB B-repeat-containing protein [Mesotoga sp.]